MKIHAAVLNAMGAPMPYADSRPLTIEELSSLDQEAALADVRVALEQVREHYDFEQHGVELVEMAGGYQILTRPIHAAAQAGREQLNRRREIEDGFFKVVGLC